MVAKLTLCIAAILLCCSAAYGFTLTFDEVPSGTILSNSWYANSYNVSFGPYFLATDHTTSTWGPPHSGYNVLTSIQSQGIQNISFYYYEGTLLRPNPIQSVGAYFSTEWNKVIKITAYHIRPGEIIPVTSITIGASGESWNNRYAELASTSTLPFEMLRFEGVNSPDDLLGFSLDDMTVTPVPEPSSLLALAGGLAGFGSLIFRRRR